MRLNGLLTTLTKNIFSAENLAFISKASVDIFIEQVNPRLICPYSIFSEGKKTSEPYKFVQGSLEQLKYILKLLFLVFENLTRNKKLMMFRF
jgi:hypothetical protein